MNWWRAFGVYWKGAERTIPSADKANHKQNKQTNKEGSMMKTMRGRLTALALIPAAVFALTAQGQPGGEEPKPKKRGMGAIEIESISATATVTAVDAAKRTVTLVNEAGMTNTYKLGKAVQNFDQIKVGDKVKATMLESVAVVIRKSSAPPNAGEAVAVAVAPKGAMPGVIMAETKEITAKILSVDAEKHMVGLEGPAGIPRMVKVGPRVKLGELQKGDDVTLRITEALAIQVEKP